jgi:hypothetical protein
MWQNRHKEAEQDLSDWIGSNVGSRRNGTLVGTVVAVVLNLVLPNKD